MITIPSAPRSRHASSLQQCVRVAATAAFVIFATGALAQERYKNPDEAAAALIAAAKAADRPALTRVLGPGSAEIVSSGDEVADAAGRKRVLEAYDARHQVVMEARTRPSSSSAMRTGRSRSHSCARTAAGNSTPRPAVTKSSFAASAATN